MCAPHSLLVGYQNKAVAKDGWNLMASTFLPVGGNGEAAKLGDIKVSNWNFWDGNDYVQFVDDGGGTASFDYEGETLASLWTYVTPDDTEDCPKAGWYHFDKAYNDGVFISGDELPLEFGCGAIFTTEDRATAIVSSGEVAKGKQTIYIKKAGWNVIGNPTPISAKFTDIAVDNWNFWDGSDFIQFLDDGGGTATFDYEGETLMALFTYVTPDDTSDCPKAGWYQFDKAYNETVFIPIEECGYQGLDAGEGVIVLTGSTETGIQFPAAL